MLETNEGFDILKQMVMAFWDTEEVPPEWEVNLLKILPKKGDLHRPGNCRGIMLLEVASKIIARLLHMRLKPIKEALDHESQCGFRPGRGCMVSLALEWCRGKPQLLKSGPPKSTYLLA